MMPDWSEFNKYLLENIGEKLHIYSDYVSFRAVSHWWKSSLPQKPKHPPHQFPYLLLPPQDQEEDQQQQQQEGDNHRNLRRFFNIFFDVVYKLELPEGFNDADRLFKGSSHGWIIAVEEKSPSIYLMNPLTHAEMQLPPVHTFPNVLEYNPQRVNQEYLVRTTSQRNPDEYTNSYFNLNDIRDLFVEKVVLSASPSTNENFMAMAIWGGFSYLGLCKLPGDRGWTKVVSERIPFSDIIFYNEKFYAIDYHAGVHVIDSNSSPPGAVRIANPLDEFFTIGDRLYLVESFGDLLMVSRNLHVDGPYFETVNFSAFKLNMNSTFTWGNWSQELETLGGEGDRVLFLGQNDSVCFSSRRFPRCEGDCIYFTDDYHEGHREYETGGADMGVFNYKHKTVQPFPGYGGYDFIWPPPIWVMLNP